MSEWIYTKEQEPTTKIDYRRAFKIACDLLNGDVLYGVDTDDIYELMMKKDGVVSSSSYEEYILNHLQELDQGQYASELTTKNNLGVVCIDKIELLKAMDTWDKFGDDPNKGLILLSTPALQDRYVPYVKYDDMVNYVKGMPSVTPQEPKWIPVSEKLPEIVEWYLTSIKWADGTERVVISWFDGTSFKAEVKAWMPLPAPYKPQKSEG